MMEMTAIQAADRLANDVQIGGGYRKALAKFIQTTSDVAGLALDHIYQRGPDRIGEVTRGLQSLILPEPKDPVEMLCEDMFPNGHKYYQFRMNDALAKRGLKLTAVDK